jgi:hypothetical protein
MLLRQTFARQTPARWLLLIVAGALLLRLWALTQVNFPGVADPNHYYNQGVRLVQGHGFTINYLWQYSGSPDAVVHPEDHWMPLAAVLAAVPMALLGIGVDAALLPFILIGALLPLPTYLAARRLGAGAEGALFAAAACAVVPELVLNSVRTDTTVPFALWVAGALLFAAGSGIRAALAAGVCVGLAYLTRNDGVLLVPVGLLTILLLQPQRRVLRAGVFLLAALVIVTPWLLRNLSAFGALSSPETGSMWFFTHHDDHYAYQRTFSLETLLAAQTPADIIGKRLFEMTAAVVMMLEVAGEGLAVALAGGLLLAWQRRERRILPALAFVAFAFLFYTLLLPYKAQAGSYKKAYLGALPLLLPLAALAVERAFSQATWRRGALLLLVGLLAMGAVQLVRADARTTSAHLAANEAAAAVARALPDTNGDGELVLMTEDPYILSYVGFASIIYPYEPRDVIAAAAQRYGVDYLLMPPNRPALNALYTGEDSDPRFVWAADVPGTHYVLFRFVP